jgi:hypothetical protein
MVKEAKFFRMQAIKAERLARAMTGDDETALDFANLAQAYRSQADTIKKSKKEKAARKKSPGAGELKDRKIGKPKNKRAKTRGS